jgi:hypothetical protein
VRTTIDLAEPVLRDLKRLQKEEKKPLGQLVSELVAAALAARRKPGHGPSTFAWVSRPMQARVDLRDKDAVYRALDGDSDYRKP